MTPRNASKRRRHVAIAYPLAVPHMTIFLRGVMDYAEQHDGWSLTTEHLLQRGLRRLAYYGLEGFWFSEERCLGFVEFAEHAGATCDVLQTP